MIIHNQSIDFHETLIFSMQGKCMQCLIPQGQSEFIIFKARQILGIFHDFFHDLFKFSMTLGLAVTFKKFQNLPCFKVFFYLKQFNSHQLWYAQNGVLFALFHCFWLSFTVFALSSAVTNLPNKTFYDRQLNSMTFQAWKMKFLDSMTFKVFHDQSEP